VVHIAKEALNGNLADGITEKELLDGGRADGAQTGQQQQQAAEARRLPRVAAAHVVAQDALRLVLQHLHWTHVAQTGSFYTNKINLKKIMQLKYVGQKTIFESSVLGLSVTKENINKIN